MGRKGKRTEHLNQYQCAESEDIQEEELIQADVFEFTICLIYYGFPETEDQEFDILNGHIPTYR